MPYNVWRLGEGGVFTTNFSRNTHFKFTKNCHTKHKAATFAKPLLQAGVCSSWRYTVIVCIGVGRKLESSFAIFGLRVSLCELQMCLQVCVAIE